MKIISLLILMTPSLLVARELQFNEAQKRVSSHELVQSMQTQAKMIESKADIDGAWGDPVLSVGANNLPVEHNFKRDVTPMSGIAFGVAQKIPLGPKLSQKKEATKLRAKKGRVDSKLLEQRLVSKLWMNLIATRRVGRDLKYLNENEGWLDSMVKVSKKLYSNGKVTQQALLDIQIRHNQVRSELSQKRADLESLLLEQKFLLGGEDTVALGTVPWEFLARVTKTTDLKEESLQFSADSAQLEQSASRWARIPEITVGLNYIKRENIDGKGDFASLMVSFPIPIGDTRSASESVATNQWLSAQSELKSYQREKVSTLGVLASTLKSLKEQQQLAKSSLSFARTARETSAKSYRLGAISYFDLLQAELRQQELEFKVNELEAKIDQNHLEEKLIRSDVLIALE